MSANTDKGCRTTQPTSRLSRDASVERAAEVFKALAHPIRLQILQVLADKGRFGMDDETCCSRDEVCVCRITELFDITAPTVSHHLKQLREAGLIEGRRDGVWIYYSICPGVLREVLKPLLALDPDTPWAEAAGVTGNAIAE